jgi:hypothetical protein
MQKSVQTLSHEEMLERMAREDLKFLDELEHQQLLICLFSLKDLQIQQKLVRQVIYPSKKVPKDCVCCSH